MEAQRVLHFNQLDQEFLNWTSEWGNGRNKQDLRFGQYLHLQYQILNSSMNGFYDEEPLRAYNNIRKTLTT